MFRYLLFILSVFLPATGQPWPDQHFTASYYTNPELNGVPILERAESRIQHDWGFNAPSAELPVNQFSARWRGRFDFEEGTWAFHTLADDGLRLWVDDRLLLDSWHGAAAEARETLVFLAAGSHRIELAYHEESGAAQVALSWAPYLDAAQCDAPLNGLCGAFFPNRTLSGPPSPLSIASSAGRLVAVSPSGFPGTGFSGRFHGRFVFAEGVTRFSMLARDGLRLWLDDRLIYDDWTAQTESQREVETFITGGEHLLRLENFRTWGSDAFALWWQTDASTTTLNTDSPLGANLAALDYWSTEWTLLDAMKTSGGWYTQTPTVWDTGEQQVLDLDEHGWVRRLPAADDDSVQYRTVTAVALNGTGGSYRAGRYLVLYKGQGTLEYGFDASYNAALSRPGRHVLDVAQPGNGGIMIRIKATDPDDHIRDLHLVPEAYFCSQSPWQLCGANPCGDSCVAVESVFEQRPFQPEFLRDLRAYRVLRLMDFLHTNDTLLEDWGERARLEDARWNGPMGAPLELALDLANATGADPWINLPTRASDDFVVQLAQLVLARLDRGRHVYIEYSNEIWNTAFANGNWVEAQAIAAWPNDTRTNYTKRINWYGKRAAEMVTLFKDVFGADAHRVIGVMGGFAAGPWASDQALACPLATGSCWQEMDALAIAPYFGGYIGQPRFATDIASWQSAADGGLDTLFMELRDGGPLYDATDPEGERAPTDGALARSKSYTQENAEIAERYGLRLIAYEGGQHLAGVAAQAENPALTNLMVAANRDPRMGELYERYLRDWREGGGDLFCHYLSIGAYSKYGSWGSKEYQQQQDAPKFQALMTFIQKYPCWWPNCTAPKLTTPVPLALPF